MNVGEIIDIISKLPRDTETCISVSELINNIDPDAVKKAQYIKVGKKFNVQKTLEFLLKIKHINATKHDNDIGDFESFINCFDLYEN